MVVAASFPRSTKTPCKLRRKATTGNVGVHATGHTSAPTPPITSINSHCITHSYMPVTVTVASTTFTSDMSCATGSRVRDG